MKKILKLLRKVEEIYHKDMLYLQIYDDESGCINIDLEDEELFSFYDIEDLKSKLKDIIKTGELPPITR